MYAGPENRSGFFEIGNLPVEVIEDPARFQSLAAQIESISGVFCEPAYEFHGHLASNDRGMDGIVAELRENREDMPDGGIGFFVGSGNIASLLPDLAIDLPVLADVNMAVLEFSASLRKVISNSREDIYDLDEQGLVCRVVARKLAELYGWHLDDGQNPSSYGASFIESIILSEAKRYGSGHWTNPHRLKLAAAALQEKPTAYVAADLANEGFATALTAICAQQAKLITFANLTNLHEWVAGSDMSFLRGLPFDPNATIIYSANGKTPLEARLARTLEDYIQAARSSWVDLTADAAWVYET